MSNRTDPDGKYTWIVADFGSDLRLMRHTSNMTLREAAKKLKCDHTWLSKVETNRQTPGWKNLKKMLALYGHEKEQPSFAASYLLRTHPEEFRKAMDFLQSRSSTMQ